MNARGRVIGLMKKVVVVGRLKVMEMTRVECASVREGYANGIVGWVNESVNMQGRLNVNG